MNEETVVAVYDTPARAELAIADLKQVGIPDSAISRHASDTLTAGTTTTGAVKEEGFWSRLFGGEPDHDTAVYDRSLQSGSSVVTVKTGEQHIDRVLSILESHQPIDIDERASSYGVATTMTAAPYAATSAYAAKEPAAGTTSSVSIR